MVFIVSNDGIKFELSNESANMSGLLRNLLEDFEEDFPVPIETEILNHVLEFCEFYSRSRTGQEIDYFERSFFNKDNKTLFEIINAADFLIIEKLVDDTCEKIASTMRNKTAFQIRELFGNEEPSREEIDEIKLTYPWAF